MFTIDSDNNIAVHAGTPASTDNLETFANEKELAKSYTAFGSGLSQVATASTTFTVVSPVSIPANFSGITYGLGNPGVLVDRNSNLLNNPQAIHYGGGTGNPGIGFGFNYTGYPHAPAPNNGDPPTSTNIVPPAAIANFPGTLGLS